MYLYPIHVTEELIDVVAAGRKVLPYLDIPLQHINDEVLRRMARRVTRRETELLLAQLRARIPQLALRTTLIAGFPGETESQFEELLAFVRQQRFERLGVFAYSCEQGTAAAKLSGRLAEEVKAERRGRLMAAQQQIAFAWNRRQIGRRMEVMLDRLAPGEDNVWFGRSPYDAPDVDGVVYVTGGDMKLTAGAIVPCEIAASRGYDLAGVPVGDPR
jgi:ribosomal protein S12 methylthiotransferase